MRRLVAFAVLILLLLPVAAAQETGPFGLRMGMQLEDIGTPDAAPSPGIYSFVHLPEQQPDVDFHYVFVGSDTGLCKIMAMGPRMQSSAVGTELKSAFRDLRGEMIARYGSPAEDHDFSSHRRPERPMDWMYRLYKKDRVLASVWKMQGRADGVSRVVIDTMAENPISGYVVASYEFSNFEQCSKEFPGY